MLFSKYDIDIDSYFNLILAEETVIIDYCRDSSGSLINMMYKNSYILIQSITYVNVSGTTIPFVNTDEDQYHLTHVFDELWEKKIPKE